MATPAESRAHQPDTSYARFRVDRASLELQFTLDLFTLRRVVPDLDADGDHRVTPAELDRAVPTVFSFLRKHLRLQINGTAADLGVERRPDWPPDAGPAIAEADYHAAVSLTTFAFRQTLSRSPEDFWIQFEWFDVLGPRHTVLGAVEERGEEYEVIFTAQDPEWLHSTSFPAPPRATPSATSDHAAAPPTSEPARSQLTGRSNLTTSAWDRTLQFFREGMHHIFTGYDHLLFLLALIVVCRPWEIVKIVTSFTIAHSLTLALAALDVVTLPSRWVETGIAATIVYVALQNFSDRPKPHRWRLTFLFGLVHGFGFAGVLADLDLSAAGFVRALLAFNLGVEAGQLIVVGLMLVPILLLRRSRFEKVGRCAISAVVALCGAAWLVDRALALEWMPF